MQHYFIEKQHSPNDYFEFEDTIADMKFKFRSCDSIFSKDEIDEGTRTLLDTIFTKVDLKGNGLDLGCGYGVIGMSIIKKLGLNCDMLDVNGTAVELARHNLMLNGVRSGSKVFKSNGFEGVEGKYDFIVTNPPIKTGKALLFELMQGCFDHLNEGGTLTLVIRKSHGEESLKKKLTEIFGNCEILKRNKGFYILHSTRTV
ncbi:MAG: class I SAM-dependent methyltransferase [Clostridia bacterium]|nr:class I SAM-dependent methyltransferase [Clostridia bacterium]